ncbi:MAG TPA: hypothetical protein VFA33_09640 [Bryobacteraceae bacterium]|nr:hypothetical protein [Bryobacteraceae bacterium]
MNNRTAGVSLAFCPRCGSYDIRPVYRAARLDALARRFALLALRCRACRRRFYGGIKTFGEILAASPRGAERVPAGEKVGTQQKENVVCHSW